MSPDKVLTMSPAVQTIHEPAAPTAAASPSRFQSRSVSQTTKACSRGGTCSSNSTRALLPSHDSGRTWPTRLLPSSNSAHSRRKLETAFKTYSRSSWVIVKCRRNALDLIALATREPSDASARNGPSKPSRRTLYETPATRTEPRSRQDERKTSLTLSPVGCWSEKSHESQRIGTAASLTTATSVLAQLSMSVQHWG